MRDMHVLYTLKTLTPFRNPNLKSVFLYEQKKKVLPHDKQAVITFLTEDLNEKEFWIQGLQKKVVKRENTGNKAP